MKKVTLENKKFQLFIDSVKLQNAIELLSNKLNRDYKDKEPIFICVLNGSFLFAAELIKRFNHNCKVSFIKVASYKGTSSTGEVNNLIGLNEEVEGKDIVIVEDIVDSGTTIAAIYEDIKKYNPSSIEVSTLLFKPKAYQKEIPVKYSALSVGNEFLVGFGLDYNGLGRNLEEIYIIEENN